MGYRLQVSGEPDASARRPYLMEGGGLTVAKKIIQ